MPKIYFYMRKATRIAIGIWLFFIHKIKQKGEKLPTNKTAKKVFIDLKSSPYRRYLYLLIKFFHASGYEVVFKANPYFMWNLIEDNFSKLLLTEDRVTFSVKKPEGYDLLISDSNSSNVISVDYFTGLLHGTQKSCDLVEEYYIPMAMHPAMYSDDLWNLEIDTFSERNNSVFFAGSFDEGSRNFFSGYKQLSKDGIFEVLDRIEICKLLIEENAFFPQSYEALIRSVNQKEKQIIIVDTEKFSIPIRDLRKLLARYIFFLACPGVIMPLSHNIVEAMSVGTIPIVEKVYAELFIPPLQHGKNAVVFDGRESLLKQIESAFLMDAEEVSRMISNVLAYYENYLSPYKVVEHIVRNKPRRMYLLGEHHSVYWLKKNIDKKQHTS